MTLLIQCSSTLNAKAFLLIFIISIFSFATLSGINIDGNYRNTSPDTLPQPGDVVNIIRIDGVGAGSNFLDMTAQTREKIMQGNFDGSIEYIGSRAPIKVRVTDPALIEKKTFELILTDSDNSDTVLTPPINWKLVNVNNPTEVYFSNSDISTFQEQEIASLGISIAIVQGKEPGNNANFNGDPDNGIIGFEEVYLNPTGPKWLTGQHDTNQAPFNFLTNSSGGIDNIFDPTNAFSDVGPGYFFPYYALDIRPNFSVQSRYITPAWLENGQLARQQMKMEDINNVDLVFTKDKTKWTRCPVIETSSGDLIGTYGVETIDGREKFDTRDALSVGKEDLDGDGLPDPVVDGKGMGWFPGYAVDVETGKRLNIVFGEATMYHCGLNSLGYFIDNCDSLNNANPFGTADMMWNPNGVKELNLSPVIGPNFLEHFAGGQHYIYILKTEYDEGEEARKLLDPEISTNPLLKARLIRNITWCGFPNLTENSSFLSYAEGLIPNDLIVKLRADNSFKVFEGTGTQNGYPTYRFTLENFITSSRDLSIEKSEIAVFPNPVSRNNLILNVVSQKEINRIQIVDVNGKLLESFEKGLLKNQPLKLNGDLYSRGVYFLKVIHSDRTVKTEKLLVP
ncbi:MAG: T9SS type A sorting domain-containing protein [Saprospiraceae bacterium]